MIPRAYLQEWSARAPWPDLRQVEQDLIICRALCDLFNAPKLKGKIAFRGGTAIHKLLFRQPLRYSEDIDLVQLRPERIGSTIDAVREALAWLGDCARNRAGHSTHLIFRFAPETAPDTELHEGLEQLGLNPGKVIACFEHYLELEGHPISRAEAEQRMLEKLTRSLTEDIDPLLPAGVRFSEDDAIEAFGKVWKELVIRIQGDAWKLTDRAVEELREKKYPKLLKAI